MKIFEKTRSEEIVSPNMLSMLDYPLTAIDYPEKRSITRFKLFGITFLKLYTHIEFIGLI